MRLVLLGPPGAGKGTQAVLISKKFGIPHISTGDILREAVANGTELGKTAQSYMTKGELVPDEVVIGIVAERLKEPDCGKGFLLDGFPRTVAQAEALAEALSGNNIALDAVLNLEVDEAEVVRRLSSRRVCASCKAISSAAEAEANGGKCAACGGELIIRADDEPAAIERRLEVYKAQTEPLIKFYTDAGLLVGINSVGCVEDVLGRVVSALGGAGLAD